MLVRQMILYLLFLFIFISILVHPVYLTNISISKYFVHFAVLQNCITQQILSNSVIPGSQIFKYLFYRIHNIDLLLDRINLLHSLFEAWDEDDTINMCSTSRQCISYRLRFCP